MSMRVDVQCVSVGDGLPTSDDITDWVQAALPEDSGDTELTVRIVDEAEGADLNQTYRQRSGPTNVLSFPFETVEGVDCPLLGDIVICAPVVLRESRDQGKEPRAHWAHMTVHGTLHLLGYDHLSEYDADHMEAHEKTILARLGFADPYVDVVIQ